MRKFRLVTAVAAVCLLAITGTLGAAAPRSGLDRHLKFLQANPNASQTIRSLLSSPAAPFSVQGTSLVANAGAVPANNYVRVLKDDVLLGDGQARADGSFAVPLATVPTTSERIEVKYAGSPFSTGFVKTDTSQVDFLAGDMLGSMATPAGDVEITPGMVFDGVDDYVAIPHHSAHSGMATALTLEAWIKTSRTGSDQPIVSKWTHVHNNAVDDVFALKVNTSGTVSVQLGYGPNAPDWVWSAVGAVNVVDGQWHHVAYVWTRPNSYLYIDGVLDSAASYNPLDLPLTTAPTEMQIGGNMFGATLSPTAFFAGQLDDVRIWNVGRTQAQIQADMPRTLTGNEAGLVGNWRFTGVIGSTVPDRTANAVAGALKGTPATTRSPAIFFSPVMNVANRDGSSVVQWNVNLPAGTNMTVSTRLSLDGGATWGSWKTVTNGAAIGGITSATNMANARLQYRADLNTTDPNATPRLQDLTVKVGGR